MSLSVGYNLLDKVLESKNYYDVVLGDKLCNSYLYPEIPFNLLNQMEDRGMIGIDTLRGRLIPIQERVEGFPSKMSGVMIEKVNKVDESME